MTHPSDANITSLALPLRLEILRTKGFVVRGQLSPLISTQMQPGLILLGLIALVNHFSSGGTIKSRGSSTRVSSTSSGNGGGPVAPGAGEEQLTPTCPGTGRRWESRRKSFTRRREITHACKRSRSSGECVMLLSRPLVGLSEWLRHRCATDLKQSE